MIALLYFGPMANRQRSIVPENTVSDEIIDNPNLSFPPDRTLNHWQKQARAHAKAFERTPFDPTVPLIAL